nr:MAG TPA: hypothetical protein [Caudoviricetes sp.]
MGANYFSHFLFLYKVKSIHIFLNAKIYISQIKRKII